MNPTPALLCAAVVAAGPATDEPVIRWVDRPSAVAAPPVQPFQLALEQPAMKVDQAPQLHTAARIDIHVEDADIRSVLRLFSSTAKINFVVPDTVQSTVTAQLTDVPWDLALAAILSAEGLQAVSFSDDVVMIEPLGTP